MGAPRQAAREARRWFPRLSEGAWLTPDVSAWPAPPAQYVLMTRQGRSSSANARVAASLVTGWLRQDWLECAPGGSEGALALSDAGRAWLLRQISGADPFQEQHQLRRLARRPTPVGHRQVLVNDAESPLGWLRSRKDANGRPMIGEAQFEAGERLREDFWRAGMSPRITSNPGAPPPGKRMRRGSSDTSAAITESALAARQRTERALEGVGPELAGVLLSVCCLSEGLEHAERSNGWPQRSGKVVLQLALTRLARHYGLTPPEASGRRRGTVRAWGAADFRPTIEDWK